MKRFVVAAALIGFFVTDQPLSLRAQRPAASEAEIKLVLMIAVDQFRADYLSRFEGDYKDG
ncbi:MAG TPA: hypothetical protein VK595_05450, partial [Vicinamibacterales bacterium]|nr:hypothetical protein [Vicinamibacterales bacterium]